MAKKVKTKTHLNNSSSNSGWRLREYILQFVVVVAGILITFQGNAWIERNSQRKQSREILEMVCAELQENLAELEDIAEIGIIELEAMAFFEKYMDNIGEAPLDSINKFMPILGTGHEFSFSSNALEVLKTSPASVNIIDKELLREIFYCYDRTGTLLKSINYYYTQKYDIVSAFYFSLDRHTIRMRQNGTAGYYFAEKYLFNPATGNWVMNTKENFGPRLSDNRKLIGSYAETMKSIGGYLAGKKRNSSKDNR